LNWISLIALSNTILDQIYKGAEVVDNSEDDVLQPACTHEHLDDKVEDHSDVNLLLPHHRVYFTTDSGCVDDEEDS